VPIDHPRRIFNRSRALPSGRTRPSLGSAIRAATLLLGVAALSATGISVASGWVAGHPPTQLQISAAPNDVAVIDGDTLRLQGMVVRLDGVVAPEHGGACRPGVQPNTDCAREATRLLAGLVHDQAVQCRLFGQDISGRPAARCGAGGLDLNRAVVASGWARAQSADYQPAETEARASHRGQWASTY
jgi:endonuclease YncB( thermonuclease family)